VSSSGVGTQRPYDQIGGTVLLAAFDSRDRRSALLTVNVTKAGSGVPVKFSLAWSGTCRDLTLKFTNGDTRTARFKFK
jgi:hypothetical protein